MTNFICFIYGDLSLRNREFILGFDDENTAIHLYEQMSPEEFTTGLFATVADGMDEGSGIIFGSNSYKLNCCVKAAYPEVQKVILCPDTTEDDRICKEYASPDLFTAINPYLRSIREFKKDIADKNFSVNECIEEEEKFGNLLDGIDKLTPGEVKALLCWMEEYSYITNDNNAGFRIFVLSVLMGFYGKKYFVKLCREAVLPAYSIHNRNFVFRQLENYLFKHPEFNAGDELDELYASIIGYWEKKLSEYLEPIPKEQRNRNRTVVIATQMINKSHAPTKSALERIDALVNGMGREVLCISTKEIMSSKGALPYAGILIGNYNEGLSGMTVQTEGEGRFLLYQPTINMPDEDEIIKILLMVHEFKPEQVIIVGNYSIPGDLCARITDTVKIPVIFSSMCRSFYGEFIAVGRSLTGEEIEKCRQLSINPDRYIESTFSFRLKPKHSVLNRKELGIPEDAFVGAVVGTRLDYDVTAEFIRQISELFDNGIFLAFAGVFPGYESLCMQIPKLKEHSVYVGSMEDILAFDEVCDFYMNPPRMGGGYSVTEAFYMGKPGVTLNYGDVAAAAGADFCVNDMDEYKAVIMRYAKDKEYYRMMSEKAIARSHMLLDGKSSLEYILTEVRKRNRQNITEASKDEKQEL